MRDRMLGSVFTKTVRDWLLWTIVALVALMVIGAFYVAMMSVAGTQYVSIMDAMPEPLANIYGTQDGTNAGMAMSGTYSVMAPIVLLSYAIGLGASAAVGEEEARTLPLLLSSPLRRRTVLVTKSVVALLGVLVILVGTWLGVAVTATAIGLDIGRYDIPGASLQLMGMVVLFGSLSLGVSAWRGSSALGISVAAGIAVLSYFATTMLPVVEDLADAARLTPWWLYTGAEALYEGIDPVLLVIAIGLAAALFGGGVYALERRDLKG
jgi:ABC-2 type transport system permease protein